jgi:aromatic ring-opening dioxygenase catalytic subunit (LigB family)
MSNTTQLPTFYLSHGGGPWPYMNGDLRQHFAKLESSLNALPQLLGAKPEVILVISGHWEQKDFAVMASPAPPMVYDFGGFPEYLYHVRYPAPGTPELARRIGDLIQDAGLPTHLDPERGFDHGAYSLLAVTYAEAKIPVLQVSIRSDYDPESHLRLGRALAPLRYDNVLIIGSGSSCHNLGAMMSQRMGFDPSKIQDESAQFDAWLRETPVDSTPKQRTERLLNWERAPFARAAHPQEDHVVPLHAAVGAAEGESAQIIYHQDDFFDKITMSSYKFGD